MINIYSKYKMCGILVISWHHSALIFEEQLKKIKHRGPDNTQMIIKDNIYFGFNRLAINDLTNAGNQPFNIDNIILLCNGEIFNHKELENKYEIECESRSDCEVILHLYKKIGFINTICALDGEFAIVLYDSNTKSLFAARDKYGVRPLFHINDYYNNKFSFASEVKALPFDQSASQFPPGYVHINGKYLNYIKGADLKPGPDTYENIKNKLYNAIKKRVFSSDKPIGALLSGGFDSSLVASVAAKCIKMNSPKANLHTFSIGHKDSSDLKFAQDVANKIGSIHHNIIISNEEALRTIPEVIYHLESYDITTIRASTPMYLLAKWIKENTDIKVVLSGEGADEYGSYLYFKYAPSQEEFDNETDRLLNQIYLFDGLRADRCIAAHGLELRVPFLDKDFSDSFERSQFRYPLNNIEKYHLRKMFSKDDLLPPDVLWRPKDAFSDSVGASWRKSINEYVNRLYTDTQFEKLSRDYTINPPKSKEALWYREIFEKYYPAKYQLTPYYWMPKWVTTNDPSAKTIAEEMI